LFDPLGVPSQLKKGNLNGCKVGNNMNIFRKHITLVFFGLTYLISWGSWFCVDATHQPLAGWIGLAAVVGAFGPSIAGLICAAVLDGRSGVRNFFQRIIRVRVKWPIYAAVAIVPLFLVLFPLVLNSLLGGPIPHWQNLRQIPALFGTLISMLLIGGLTEEPGWRGFALPVLRERHGSMAASMILGILWGMWHIPIYSLPGLGDPLPIGNLIRFILTTPLLTILFTVLAEKSKDSVWIAMLFHAWNNTVASLPLLLGVHENEQLSFLNFIVMILVIVPIIWVWLQRSQKPLPAKSPG
jgi:membrane protease YdiL (CAAX protease family)